MIKPNFRSKEVEALHSGQTSLFVFYYAGFGFHSLKATVTLGYAKGKRQSMNDSIERYLGPLRDEDVHVCPLAWLMIHALQNRLLYRRILHEVLYRVMERSDHLR